MSKKRKRVPSLISSKQECYVCKKLWNLHMHHIFYGAGRRSLSDQYGCWVYLCAYHHNMSDEGVHFNKERDLRLKRECQEEWEKQYGSREDFIRVFGKSYL